MALIAVLEALEPPFADGGGPSGGSRRQLVCVANTHIHSNPELNDVKLWQVRCGPLFCKKWLRFVHSQHPHPLLPLPLLQLLTQLPCLHSPNPLPPQVHTLLKGLEKIAASADIPMLVRPAFFIARTCLIVFQSACICCPPHASSCWCGCLAAGNCWQQCVSSAWLSAVAVHAHIGVSNVIECFASCPPRWRATSTPPPAGSQLHCIFCRLILCSFVASCAQVAGDFNTIPGSAAHSMLVKGSVQPANPVRARASMLLVFVLEN